LFGGRVGQHVEIVDRGGGVRRYTVREFYPRWPITDTRWLKPGDHEEIVLITCTTYNYTDPRIIAVGEPGRLACRGERLRPAPGEHRLERRRTGPRPAAERRGRAARAGAAGRRRRGHRLLRADGEPAPDHGPQPRPVHDRRA